MVSGPNTARVICAATCPVLTVRLMFRATPPAEQGDDGKSGGQTCQSHNQSNIFWAISTCRFP